MSRLSTFLAGMAAGAALLYAAMSFHVIRASDGVHLVAKPTPRLSDTFVDVRAFGVSDWAARPQLAAALVQADKQHLLGGSAADLIQQKITPLLPDWPKQ